MIPRTTRTLFREVRLFILQFYSRKMENIGDGTHSEGRHDFVRLK